MPFGQQRRVEVRFPVRGQSQVFAASDEPDLTTRSATNVRARDPKTGQIRGAQRGGHRKYAADRIDTDPIRAIGQVVYDRSSVDFASLGASVTVDWSRKVAGLGDVRNIVLDNGGGVIVVSNSSELEKYNPDGERVWRVAVPIRSSGGVIRALAISLDGTILVGESFSNLGRSGRIVAYVIGDDGEPEVLWQIDTDGLVVDIATDGSAAYTLENDDPAGTSTVKKYLGINGNEPAVSWSKSVPFPAIAVSPNLDTGIVGVAIRENPARSRLAPPSFCGTARRGLDLNTDIPNAAFELWSWFDGYDPEFDGLSDGDEVTYWPDRSGQGRFLAFTRETFLRAPPTFTKRAHCLHPGVTFAGPSGRQALVGVESFREFGGDRQLSAVPASDGQSFIFAIMYAPSQFSEPRGLLHHDGESPFSMGMNTLGGVGDDEEQALFSSTRNPATTREGPIDRTKQLCINVLFHAGDDTAGSFFRVNGEQAGDAWTYSRDKSNFRLKVGVGPDGVTSGRDGESETHFFEGSVLAIVCYRRIGAADQATTMAEIIEGHLAHVAGTPDILPADHTYRDDPPLGADGTAETISTNDALSDIRLSPHGIQMFLNPVDGAIKSAITGAGMGIGMAWDSDGGITTIGRYSTELVLYRLVNCDGSGETIYTYSDLSDFVGEVVVLAEGGPGYTVSVDNGTGDVGGGSTSGTQVFESFADCTDYDNDTNPTENPDYDPDAEPGSTETTGSDIDRFFD